MANIGTTLPAQKTWTIQKTLNWGFDFLSRTFLETPEVDAKVILFELLDLPVGQIYLRMQETLPRETIRIYQGMIKRRSQFEPISYIIGKKNFFGIDFKVDKRVLTPRPETELLVETCIELVRKYEIFAPKILDVGTGSGCISISLAKTFRGAFIVAMDVSKEALDVAKDNAAITQVQDQIRFIQNDLFDGFDTDYKGYFDIIVSNPPYVPTSDWGALNPDLFYEPRQALVGGPDGLFFIERIIRQGKPFLQPKGTLLLEIGIGQSQKVKEEFQKQGFMNVTFRNDYSNIERVIYGMKNEAI